MKQFPREIKQKIDIALQDTPVVLVNGPRQAGKTTMVKGYQERYEYYTLDDARILSAAKQDPIGFVSHINNGIIDEIQHAPELLFAIKVSVDENRQPGRFILTGSANLLAIPKVGESLAGRMEVLTLLPLSLGELTQSKHTFLEKAITHGWQSTTINESVDCMPYTLSGGYPEMLNRKDPQRRSAWARSYIQSILERDVKDIANIDKLFEMPKLLNVLAKHSGKLINFTQIGAQLGLDTKTTQKYVSILETLFLVRQIQPWYSNQLNRLVKTPKLHFIDSGLLAVFNQIKAEHFIVDKHKVGPLLETWVFGELFKMINNRGLDWQIFHYRDKEQSEIDFVLENADGQLIGIEVKASKTIIAQDFSGLKKLSLLTGEQWITGIVLYDGDRCIAFGDKLWAIPFSQLV